MNKLRTGSAATPRRFKGPGRVKRLTDALAEQFMLGGNTEIASSLARRVTVKQLSWRSTLITQGDEDSDLAFILSGSVEIVVNGHTVATRRAGSHVGEMALLDPLSRRSATVRAAEDTVVATIPEREFGKIGSKYPQLWRRLALSLAERLRERAKFHRPPNQQPAVFIGSSSEGLSIAECLHRSLRRGSIVPRLWSDGVFECSQTAIEDLTKTAAESDFAILVLTKDDLTTSRAAKKHSPRDNVVFELGLFMGSLTRSRTYILAPTGLDIKIPTDLLGLNLLLYADTEAPISKRIRTPLKAIRRQISNYGPRHQLGAA